MFAMKVQLKQKFFHNALRVLAAILTLTAAVSAQEVADRSAAPKIEIKNFGRMDERFYRGAQPKREEDYKALAALGVNTIINLRHDPKENERQIVESLGMRYVNIPMISKKYPTEEAVRSFLSLVDDPATGKFFVHCAGGRHRTGALGAVYRYHFYNWNFGQVYSEMKQYDFYTGGGHGGFKVFVEDYHERIQAMRNLDRPLPVTPQGSEQRR